MIKYPDNSNLKEKRVVLTHNYGLQSVITQNTRWQDLEANGHITSTVKTKEQ